jgi:hypothetical protein
MLEIDCWLGEVKRERTILLTEGISNHSWGALRGFSFGHVTGAQGLYGSITRHGVVVEFHCICHKGAPKAQIAFAPMGHSSQKMCVSLS